MGYTFSLFFLLTCIFLSVITTTSNTNTNSSDGATAIQKSVTTNTNTNTNSSVVSTTIRKSKRLVTPLIHRDSVLSPFYNASATAGDRAKRDFKNSLLRMAYLQARINTDSNDIRNEVVAGETIFYVKIFIGQWQSPQYVMMDTGSGLLWIHCEPCYGCEDAVHPIFDPMRSKSYRYLFCDSPYCDSYIKGMCLDKICRYTVQYFDNSSSYGTLSSETLTFPTFDEGTVNFSNIVFGCGRSGYEPNHQSSGVLGLGSWQKSLVCQLGHKFSYCIASITDVQYPYNQITFGDGAEIRGQSTPMEIHNGHYYLSLEDISVGQKRLHIEPLRKNKGVIIDTGSTMGCFAKNVFEVLKQEVKSLIDGLLGGYKIVGVENHPSLLCYRGIVSRDLNEFPKVTFHLGGGANYELDIENMFININDDKEEDAFCMAVEMCDADPSILGLIAQQYFNIAYDLRANQLYFDKIDCGLLDD